MAPKIICLSEHFHPRIGGTVYYVHQICSALSELGLSVQLLVPGPKPDDVNPSRFSYEVEWIDCGYPVRGEPDRTARYNFCRMANGLAQNFVERGDADLVHILYGMFLIEELDTATLRRSGIPSIATVHNLPPMECRRAWPSAPVFQRAKDALRVQVVKLRNDQRLRQREFTTYVTPSAQVQQALASVKPKARIAVVEHGYSGDLLRLMCIPSCRRPPARGPISLLTVAGWAPHKRQHIIPEIASRLRREGLAFHWNIAGPDGRVSGYKEAVDAELAARGQLGTVHTHGAVSPQELARLYDQANLYVQPSTEEGFCITALDAAAAGLPVIGSPAGALPSICQLSGGRLVRSEAEAVARAIIDFRTSDAWPPSSESVSEAIRNRFTWMRTAKRTRSLYENSWAALKGKPWGSSPPGGTVAEQSD